MKLHLNIYKHKDKSNNSEIRHADPPFDVSNVISLSRDGRVVVDVFTEVVDAIKEVDDEQEWFDSIQWTIPLAELVSDFVGFYTRSGDVVPEPDGHDDILELANAFDEAAKMLRATVK